MLEEKAVTMSCLLLSLPDDVMNHMLGLLHVVDLYEMYCNHICKLLDILCKDRIMQTSNLTLIINSKRYIRGKTVLIGRAFHCKQIIVTNASNIFRNKKITHLMQLISYQIKHLTIMGKIKSINTELPNVSHLRCCYPLNNMLILKNLTALKWITITALNKCIWNILSKYCPTLSALITINSFGRTINIWCKDKELYKNTLNTMNNLQVLVICDTISIELIPYILDASPSLVHFIIDGRITVDNDPNPIANHYQTTLQTLKIPKQMVFFGISSICAAAIDVDFSQSVNLKVLNIPLLSCHRGSLKLSSVFVNFICSKHNNDTIIVFKKNETIKFFGHLDEKKCILEIQSNFFNSTINANALNVVVNNDQDLDQDNCLITKILKSLFYENTLNFIETNTVNTTIIDYLTEYCGDREYIQLLIKATQIGYICNDMNPITID